MDLETVFCFLDFQEIKKSPRKMQKLVMDLLESGQAAQSTSAKAFMCNEVFDGKKKSLTNSPFNVLNDPISCLQMRLSRLRHKLT